MELYKRPIDAIKAEEAMWAKNKRTDIKANFNICKLEGKDNYKRGQVDIDSTIAIVQQLIKLYPQFEKQLSLILKECMDKYTFPFGLDSIDSFKSELAKFYIHKDSIAMLLLDEDEHIDNTDDVYKTLYAIYKQCGPLEIQRRIDNIQNVDWIKLFNAEEGYRIHAQHIDFKSQQLNMIDIPNCDDMFVDSKG